MDQKLFEFVVVDTLAKARELLFQKNSGYNPTDDKLKGFKNAAGLTGETPEKALSGMMLKHTVSVYSLAASAEEVEDPLVWDEKLLDHINYLILLRALVIERRLDKYDPPF